METALVLLGEAGNGKSVVHAVAMALLGKENTCNYSLQSLTDRRGRCRAMLQGKLLNYCSELSPRMDEDRAKQLISNEPIEAQQENGEPFILDPPYAKLMFNANRLPASIGQTEAVSRRFRIIPFRETIPEEEQDKQLAQKIIESELSGVFNLVLVALLRLLAQKGFTRSAVAATMVQQDQQPPDTVQLFVSAEGLVPDFSYVIPLKSLFAQYQRFCIDSGYKWEPHIRERLHRLGFTTTRRNKGYIVFAAKKDSNPAAPTTPPAPGP